MIALNTAWNLYNFRSGLIRAYVAMGYEVVAVAPPDEYAPLLAELGCRFVPLHFDTQGISVFEDLILLLRFWQLLSRERPALFLGFTVKPNIYGSLAAAALGIPVFNNIAGLGTVFSRSGWLPWLVKRLYKIAIRKSSRVFFKNPDDRRLFIEGHLVRETQTGLLPGSGVDLSRYAEQPLAVSGKHRLRFLLVARLLWDKGIGEYVEAARAVRAQFPGTEFQILGFLDAPNPRAVSQAVVDQWASEGVVQYLGSTDDVRPFLAAADCVVLPSYYMEGTPRSLLEAAAMARPIITTDWIGCREVVDDGVNGLLCKPAEVADLADKMLTMIKLSPRGRAAMGRAGRVKVESQFDERIVIDAYLQATGAILQPTPKNRATVLIALNTAWNLVNFRSGLIRGLVGAGYEVVAVAPRDGYAPRLAALGCRYVELPMDNRGTHPGRDLLLLLLFVRLFRRERPDVYLGYTVKPNVYGSIAARWLRIPAINNIAGLGAVFIQGGRLAQVVRWLYRKALAPSRKVFFQNDDDRQMFISDGLVRAEVADLLPGSGIDLARFSVAPPRGQADMQSGFRFLLIARMLRDKGIVEYVEAAALLKERWPNAEFCLLGFVDVQNPTAVSKAQMDAWVAQGHVRYLGLSDDVRAEIATADCVVLPSYREGTPRTLLEAAAMGRPIVATDAVGCREVVDDGHNGFLCQPRDAADLASKMEQMLLLTPDQRAAMGLRGREKMEREFDERIVIQKYLASIEQVMAGVP